MTLYSVTNLSLAIYSVLRAKGGALNSHTTCVVRVLIAVSNGLLGTMQKYDLETTKE
jgi:hypothetical protein